MADEWLDGSGGRIGKKERIVPAFYESFYISQEYKEQRNISKSQQLKIKIMFYFPEGLLLFFLM